jgi:uncharacterized protein
MKRMFVDTSALFAYADVKDPQHRAVRTAIHEFDGRLATSNFIFDETVTLVRCRIGNKAAVLVSDAILEDELTDLVRLTADDERAAWQLFKRRTDKLYSFTDCTSFVLMRRLGISEAIALDEDFRSEGFNLLPA